MNSDAPKILGFVVNMMFTTRIESVVEGLGYQVQWVDPITAWKNPRIDEITEIDPVLILVDLGIADIQWEQWIRLVKANPATSGIPQLSFGSHMDVGSITRARQAGADRVISRSQFFSSIADTIQKYAVSEK